MDEDLFQVTLDSKEYQLVKEYRRRLIDKIIQELSLREIRELIKLCKELQEARK